MSAKVANRVLQRVLQIVLVLAFSAFVFTGERSNQMLISTARAPAVVCRSRPAEYQVVEMKAPVCVPNHAAVAWKQNQRYLQLALLACAASFLALFLIQRKKAEAPTPDERSIVPFGVVACFGVFLFWGIVPALVCAAAVAVGLLCARLYKLI